MLYAMSDWKFAFEAMICFFDQNGCFLAIFFSNEQNEKFSHSLQRTILVIYSVQKME